MKDYLISNQQIITKTLLTIWLASAVITIILKVLVVIRGENNKKD